MTSQDVYKLTEDLIKDCRERGYSDIVKELDDAMHLGSSGLEILGAIRTVITSHPSILERVADRCKLQEVIDFVDEAYGRRNSRDV